MKFNTAVSSCSRKNRKARATAPSGRRRKLMSSPLDPILRYKHHINSAPVHKDDEVRVLSGDFKGREGKVISVYRKKWVIHVDCIFMESIDGQTTNVGLDPSNCMITNFSRARAFHSRLK